MAVLGRLARSKQPAVEPTEHSRLLHFNLVGVGQPDHEFLVTVLGPNVAEQAHRLGQAPGFGTQRPGLVHQLHHESRIGLDDLTLFARSLAQRFDGSGRTANALHPGMIKTNLGRHSPETVEGFFKRWPDQVKSIPQGAATQCLLAVHPGVAEVNGDYYSDCQPQKMHDHALDDGLRDRLWDVTEKIVAGLG